MLIYGCQSVRLTRCGMSILYRFKASIFLQGWVDLTPLDPEEKCERTFNIMILIDSKKILTG